VYHAGSPGTPCAPTQPRARASCAAPPSTGGSVQRNRLTRCQPDKYHKRMGYQAGEGPGAGAVATVCREFSVLRGATAPAIGVWPGRYEADQLRATIGSQVFADLVGCGDIRVESE